MIRERDGCGEKVLVNCGIDRLELRVLGRNTGIADEGSPIRSLRAKASNQHQ